MTKFGRSKFQADTETMTRQVAIGKVADGRLKAFVFFKGREMKYRAQGEEILKKLIEVLEPYGVIENPIKMEGNRMLILLKPKKKTS